MKWLMRVLSALAGVAVTIALLLTVIRGVALDQDHYLDQYRKNGTAAAIGTDEAGLSVITDNLIQYLSGKTDTLSAQVEIDGQPREFYNQRERDHMVDVQRVMNTVNTLSYALYAFTLIVLAAALFLPEKWRINPFLPLLIGMGLGILALAALGCYAYFDFSGFWTAFHGALFRNDLWILNPATDYLIRLVPEPFFFATCMKIVVQWGLVLAAAFVAIIVTRIMGRKKMRLKIFREESGEEA